MSEKPYLSDAIVYDEEIAPHRFIALYAGVGSGKNTFINKIINGDPEKNIPKKTVLLITSRKSKVNELLSDDDITAVGKVGRWGNLHKELSEADDRSQYRAHLRRIRDFYGDHYVYQQSVVCTNAFIEKYFQYCYNPEDATTHLWELFDLIVIDEVHSLLLDATYQSAPYYVQRLVEETLDRHADADENQYNRRPLCERIILMTGTPAALRHLMFGKHTPTVIDKRETCKNVRPHNIHFLNSQTAKQQIAQQVANGERAVYFSNHIVFPDSFDKDKHIPTDRIAVSFSDQERRKELKRTASNAFAHMDAVEESLAEYGSIPAEFSLLLTTGKNKEGINISDPDVQHVYVETHNISDIQQMAGRVRHGAQNLYIITDAMQFENWEWEMDRYFARFAIVEDNLKKDPAVIGDNMAANSYLKMLCEKKKIALYGDPFASVATYSNPRYEVGRFISYIHEKFPFVKYDYIKNIFCYYRLKFTGLLFQMEQTLIFEHKLEHRNGYLQMMQDLFPSATIHPYLRTEDLLREYIEALLIDNPKRTFAEEEILAHLEALNTIWSSSPQQHYPEIGYLLKKIGYKKVRASKDSSRPSYHRFRYVKCEG